MGSDQSAADVSRESTSTRVHPLNNDQEGDDNSAGPDHDSPVKLLMQDKAFNSRSGQYSIQTLSMQPRFSGGIDMKHRTLLLDRDGSMVLRGAKREPLALCQIQQKFLKSEQIFRIYSFTPVVQPNQKPSRKRHEQRALYKWAEIKKSNEANAQYTLRIWDGHAYVPTSEGDSSCDSSDHGETKQHQTNFEFFRGHVWRTLSAPQGLDPCLVICFDTIVAEMGAKNRQ